jgi:two-component system cell cycle sensor histidine kinase/response regulator CckA
VGKGSGLGLSTVYGIAKQSGGSIWAYSEPGKGTTFKIYLPRVQEAAHSIQHTPPVAPVQGSETVLIAEDDPGVRHAATRLLQLTGYTVLSASSGTEALSLLERHEGPVHLMLTDMIMPGMGGRELATLLREVRPQMKVVFTSGYTNDAILQNGLLDETAHFIGKPYTAVDLRRKVREVLDS